MAIAILTQPDYFLPVYSVQEWTLYDAVNYGASGFYYQIEITVGSETRIIKQLKDENNKAVIDVQTILQSFIESEWTWNPALVSHNTDICFGYSIVAKSIWTASSSTSSSVSKKVFNGVDHYNRTWDTSLYEFRADTPGLFLTSYHGPRDMHINDMFHINFLYGQSNGIDSSVNGITFTRYNGSDVSTYTYDYPISSTDVSVYSLTVDASALPAGFIDSNTTTITVAESTGLSETLTFNLVSTDVRYDRYYRISYIDHLGSTEYQNFDLVPENTVDISKTSYVNDRTIRIFGTKVDDNYLVRTNWISCERSEGLKDLWYAPKVGLMPVGKEDYTVGDLGRYPIVINDSTKQILNRHNTNHMINYTLGFTMAEEYSVQQQ